MLFGKAHNRRDFHTKAQALDRSQHCFCFYQKLRSQIQKSIERLAQTAGQARGGQILNAASRLGQIDCGYIDAVAQYIIFLAILKDV